MRHMERTSLWIGVGALVLALPAVPSPPLSSIPLRAGLTIVTAIKAEPGDYESIKRVIVANSRGVTLTVSGDVPTGDDPLAGLLGGGRKASGKPELRHTHVRRTVRRDDLREAHDYRQAFLEDDPETIAGSTALGISAAGLRELKANGESDLMVFDPRGAAMSLPEGLAGGLAGALGGMLGGARGRGAAGVNDKAKGRLRLNRTGPDAITVLVNGVPEALAVVHASGQLGGLASDFFFLDDPDNPLTIRYAIGEDRLQVVRIEFPPEPGTSQTAGTLAAKLAATGKADVYGIYFDFGSDRIKEESEPVLTEIAGVLAGNPAWTLGIDGHTDNIGGDAANLDLSKRRAAAVKQALVSRYKVAAARLSTEGFGASQPKATNNTLEGRARNRRVELTRK